MNKLILIQNITDDMCRVLNEHDYSYNISAVRKIVARSLEAKKDLIELFSKNPYWNEEQLCIHFAHDYERNIDPCALRNFLNWLWDASENPVRPEGTTRMCEVITWSRNGFLNINENIYDDLLRIPPETALPDIQDESQLNYWQRDQQQKYQRALERINALDDKWNFRPGMKLNRIVNKICIKYGWDKLPGYDREYAVFSDSMNPLKVERQTTISVNPIDFLLMSNGNSWRSCHWIGDGEGDAGCYSSGTISYMLGEDSFIVSAIDKNAGEDRLAEKKKILRQVFGYRDYQLLQSRLYPQSCDAGSKALYSNIREMVEEIISKALDEPNRWVKGNMDNIASEGTAYQDWECQQDICSVHILKSHEEDDLMEVMMTREPICIKCGCEHMDEECIVCQDCKGYYCPDCGCRIDFNDEDSYNEWDGEYYCTDCRIVCDRCGALERHRYSVWISDIEQNWCEYCADRYATRCEYCGEYISEAYEQDHDGYDICEACYDSHYNRCHDCGELYLDSDLEIINGNSYCPDCADKIREENESA